MATSSWNAGIIRPVAVAPTGPFQDGAAPGVWTIDEAAFWTQQGLWPTAGNVAPVAATVLFAGNYGGAQTSVIQKVSITTTGNTTDFGDLAAGNYGLAAFASTTRGVFAGGEDGTGAGSTNTIQYVTIASAGNATDFGDLTFKSRYQGGCNSATRGVNGAGYSPSTTAYISTLNYVTIATTGDATSFGALTVTRVNMTGACSNSTRGVFSGANNGSNAINVMDYITIASAGNATDFGDLTFLSSGGPCACSNSTRGVLAGGMNDAYDTLNTITYITIATAGNASAFGDLTVARNVPTGGANNTRAIFGGGESGSKTNIIDYVTIATTGNATDFGDLLSTATNFAGLSSFNGGVQ